MRRNSALILLAAVAAAPACSLVIDSWSEKATRTDMLEHPAGDATGLIIDGYNGEVTVTSAPDVRTVTGTSRLYAQGATKEAAAQRLQQMQWSWSQEGDDLLLELSRPEQGANNAGGSIDTLLVPEGWNVEVRTSNGGVSIGSGFNRVMVESSNGNIEASGDGEIRLRTSNGRIKYSGASTDFILRSSNGGIDVKLLGDWSGNGVVDTSNGSISVRCSGTVSAALETHTSNGKARVYGPTPTPHASGGGGLLRLDTSNGNINLTHAGG